MEQAEATNLPVNHSFLLVAFILIALRCVGSFLPTLTIDIRRHRFEMFVSMKLTLP